MLHPVGATADPLNGTGIHHLIFHHHVGQSVAKAGIKIIVCGKLMFQLPWTNTALRLINPLSVKLNAVNEI